MDDLLDAALDAAAGAGAGYADVRIVETRSEKLTARGEILESSDAGESIGFGVRALAGGAWGYAASAVPGRAEVQRVAARAVAIAEAAAQVTRTPVELVPEPAHRGRWATPVDRDPFEVPFEDKAALLVAAASALEAAPGVRVGRASMDLLRYHSRFRSTEGTDVDQTITHAGGGMSATAVEGDDVQVRSYPASFRDHILGGGYEVVEELDFLAHVDRVADEATALLGAPECPAMVTTLVLDGHQMALQVHESVGHATELDRVLGMEASFAGTSFVSVGDVGGLRYGSRHVSIAADATTPRGLGTFGFDDEGVEAQSFLLVDRGRLVGLQASRETAGAVGLARSNGTMRAEGWENFPLIRMTNINLVPGSGSFDDLIADIDHGIFMSTNRSWSIDDKRLNFQFGCEIAWEIKDGRLGRMFKNPRYTGITPQFWGLCDAVAGESEWRMWSTANCGKGQPGQTMRVGHGTAPARFREITIGTGG